MMRGVASPDKEGDDCFRKFSQRSKGPFKNYFSMFWAYFNTTHLVSGRKHLH